MHVCILCLKFTTYKLKISLPKHTVLYNLEKKVQFWRSFLVDSKGWNQSFLTFFSNKLVHQVLAIWLYEEKFVFKNVEFNLLRTTSCTSISYCTIFSSFRALCRLKLTFFEIFLGWRTSEEDPEWWIFFKKCWF